MASPDGSGEWRRVFVYGTLRTGRHNHYLIEESIKSGGARFLTVAMTREKYPLTLASMCCGSPPVQERLAECCIHPVASASVPRWFHIEPKVTSSAMRGVASCDVHRAACAPNQELMRARPTVLSISHYVFRASTSRKSFATFV